MVANSLKLMVSQKLFTKNKYLKAFSENTIYREHRVLNFQRLQAFLLSIQRLQTFSCFSYLLNVSPIQFCVLGFFVFICFHRYHNLSYLVFSSFFFLSFHTHGQLVQCENINHKKICGHSV